MGEGKREERSRETGNGSGTKGKKDGETLKNS